MKLQLILLLCSLLFTSCRDRTVGGPVGPAGPNSEYYLGKKIYSDSEWSETSLNRLDYYIYGSRNPHIQKVYVDFRYNGLEISALPEFAYTNATCYVQVYAADGSMLDNIKIVLRGNATWQNRFVYSRPVDYVILDMNGDFSKTRLALVSYAR